MIIVYLIGQLGIKMYQDQAFTAHVSPVSTALSRAHGFRALLALPSACVTSRQKAKKAKEAKEHVKAKENFYDELFFLFDTFVYMCLLF